MLDDVSYYLPRWQRSSGGVVGDVAIGGGAGAFAGGDAQSSLARNSSGSLAMLASTQNLLGSGATPPRPAAAKARA
jgi:hypothetical protein